MNQKIKFSLVVTTAIAAVLANPSYAQQSRSDGGSGVLDLENPTYDANTSLGVVTGDNLGNHIADGELNMNGFAVFNMGEPTDPMDGVSLQYLENYVDANGDNLGDHTATKVLNMGGFAINQLPAPTGPTQAANRAYVDTAVAGAGDDLGNHIATEALDMDGHRIMRLADPVSGKDGVPFSFLEQYVEDNGDHLGNHIATRDLDMKDFKVLNVMDPTDDKDGVNKLYVDGLTSGVDDRIDDLESIEIIAGTGLQGGGDLTQNRTISFNTTWGDDRYAQRSRVINAGTGLTGGGNLAANRTIALNLGFGDNRWINRTANVSITGTKTFTGPVIVNTPSSDSHAANKGYVDDAVDGVANSLIAGDGLTKTGRTFSVDGSVLRTFGNQHILGVKTFSHLRHFADGNESSGEVRFGRSSSQYLDFHGGSSGNFITSVSNDISNVPLILRLQNGGNTHNFAFRSDGRIQNVATPTANTDAANKSYVDAAAAAAVGTTYTVGTGLKQLGTHIHFDVPWGDDRYARRGRNLIAGDGLTGGGTLSANRTFAVDSSVVRTSRSINAGTGLSGGGNLGGNRTISVDGTVFRSGAAVGGNLRFGSGNGRGMRFWDSDNYKIFMSSTGDANWGRRLDSSSDYNMYFRMASGSNRGFVFQNGSTPVFQVAGNGHIYGSNGEVIRDRNGGWVRTYGNTGWYNGTYGGGWYMTDNDYVRAYSNKSIYTGGRVHANAGIRVDGREMITGNAQLSANNKVILNVATPTSSSHAANKAYVDSKAGSNYSAGTGIGISGNTISFNTPWGDGRYAMRGRSINTGAGLTGGGNLASNRTISLASNYIRRSASSGSAGLLAYNGHNRAGGQLYGGNTNPNATTRLNYNGSLYATRFYSTAYYYFSDRNLKKDIETIEAESGMGLVRDLRPVSYVWRENDQKALGVIAQEVEDVLPTAVTTNEAGLKAVDYTQMIAPMLAAIQELDERVQALEEAAH
ncbi:shufflon system plasmid conjugative transfer pilus tip adhesin PilV [Epibacterium sp. DP7N7-1]|nr:shufflon system plasmid conjugative transfer pilus tip adhesin PilV [Epibacterium sp. DP7N7-1]